ncbi:hypothetical protein Tco_1073632, partial [Tanacetum coccineum]
MFEFSSCLLADYAINLVSGSSRLGLWSGYKEFHCFVGRILALLLYIVLQVDRVHRIVYSKLLLKFFLLPFVDNPSYSVTRPSEVSGTSGSLKDVPIYAFLEYSSISWMAIFSITRQFWRSVEYQYAVLSSKNTPYCLKEHILRLDYKTQYAVLGRRFDTSYPTGGYGVSVILLDAAYGKHRGLYAVIGKWFKAFSCRSPWRGYAVSLSLDTALLTDTPVGTSCCNRKSRRYVCAVYGDSVQQECYRPLDMAASMDTHADVT